MHNPNSFCGILLLNSTSTTYAENTEKDAAASGAGADRGIKFRKSALLTGLDSCHAVER